MTNMKKISLYLSLILIILVLVGCNKKVPKDISQEFGIDSESKSKVGQAYMMPVEVSLADLKNGITLSPGYHRFRLANDVGSLKVPEVMESIVGSLSPSLHFPLPSSSSPSF